MITIDLDQDGVQQVTGPAGIMELIIDRPRQTPCGMAIVAHPQPLLGGNATHKVPHFLALALRDAGWLTVRPNFRGVGASHGSHDYGQGETEDLLALHAAMVRAQPVLPVALVGFSFGAFVQARVALALAGQGAAPWRVCLTGMPFGIAGDRLYETPDGVPNAAVIHGELDERVPLSAVFDWARPTGQPVTVIPGANHFFTGKLPLLRNLVLAHLER